MYGAGLAGGFVGEWRSSFRVTKPTNNPTPTVEPTPSNTHESASAFDDFNLSLLSSEGEALPAEVCTISGFLVMITLLINKIIY